MSEQASRVVIHKEERDEIYLKVAQDVAEAAGWESIVCEGLDETVEAMAESNAVVTGLGYVTAPFGAAEFPSWPILAEAAKLDIPTAILSGHPSGAHQVRQASQDIYISTIPYDRIAPKLQAWFSHLAQKSPSA